MASRPTPDNTEDIIDSRDIIARIDELESDEENLDEMDREELQVLRAVAREGEDYAPDWKYGETMIRESHFEDYARELAEDVGSIKESAEWPYTCIDWTQAARELRQDYSEIDFDGVTYLIRS